MRGADVDRLDVIQISADRGIAPGSTKGAAQHLRGIAAGLVARGHRVTTYTPRSAEGPFPAAVQPLEALDLLVAAESLAAGSVVYERYSLGHRGGLELARRLGVPFVLEVNAPLVDEARAHRPDTVRSEHIAIEAELLAEADLVITVSSALTTWAEAGRVGPTITLANGFEPAWFSAPARPERATAPLVFIGHPKPWHGADRLVDLLVDLAQLGLRPDLLIIGGGPGADALRATAQREGVGSQLTITGALPPKEASALLSTGSVGLAPYRRQEPFYFCPLKVIDYLAAGLPIVASELGDIPELVGDAGVLVDPDDAKQLTAAVARLLDRPEQRASMGEAGRRRAMATRTWTDVATRTESALLARCRAVSA